MKLISLFVFTALLMTACGSENSGTANSASTEVPAFNPAHGQPHHDCALPVGAPLKQETPAPAPVAAPTATPAPTPVVKALNPAHGQPGHRCDIAVGAPLN